MIYRFFIFKKQIVLRAINQGFPRKNKGIQVKLFYGDEFFKFLNMTEVYEELIDHLKQYKQENNDVPFNPFNTNNSLNLFTELVNLDEKYWNKLNSDDEIYLSLRNELFKTNEMFEQIKLERRKK
ncbi:hypothetical protein [Ureaplasma canigenitalium]|uniref:hypothetical protein n=1 Tax=Ureaplasma canigenitalium TaxID=42092 RepID=UPI00068D0EE5|nr:hypothetical protein [Ureaplasma canigenitalium]